MRIIIPIVNDVNIDDENSYLRSLYEIERKTVFQSIYEFLAQIHEAEFIVILRRDNVKKYYLDDMIRLLIPNVKIIVANSQTRGSACSCLLAIDQIDMEEPLVIAGGEQLFLKNPQLILEDFQKKDLDGDIVTFEDIHPRWSYVKLNQEGFVIEAAEKRPISRHATAGFYYFKKGEYFIESVKSMIRKHADFDDQYYICPAYNEMVLLNRKVGIYPIEKTEYFNFKQKRGINEYENYLRTGRRGEG